MLQPNDNFRVWIDTLRTTDKPQVEGRMAKEVDGVMGYCCLGLGSTLVPDMPVSEYETIDGEGYALSFGGDGNDDLAPTEFIDWLGLDWVGTLNDLLPDWPLGLVEQGPYDADPTRRPRSIVLSAASLNDAGFTFAQIADVFDYFGICRVLEG